MTNTNIAKQYSREIKLMFLQFLKKNNALKIYKQNVINQNKIIKLTDKINPLQIEKITQILNETNNNYYTYFKELINCAFYWRQTPQGHNYWQLLDIQWKQKVTRFVNQKYKNEI